MKIVKRYKLYFLFLLIIVITWVTLTPALSNTLFPPIRQQKLSNFITTLKQTQKLDPQTYWQFREFYTPGTSTFSNTYQISPEQIPNDVSQVLNPLKDQASISPFLVFNSSRIHSLDALTAKSLDLLTYTNSSTQYLVKTPHLLLSEDEQNYYLVSLLPTTEMKKANGFFQDDTNSPYFDNKYWLDVAVIKKQ